MPELIQCVDVGVILLSWYLKALGDAIIFAKGGRDTHEVWHGVDWVRSWVVPGWFGYRMGFSLWQIVIIIVGSFGFNLAYNVFRNLNVVVLDDRFRWMWIGKILGRGGLL